MKYSCSVHHPLLCCICLAPVLFPKWNYSSIKLWWHIFNHVQQFPIHFHKSKNIPVVVYTVKTKATDFSQSKDIMCLNEVIIHRDYLAGYFFLLLTPAPNQVGKRGTPLLQVAWSPYFKGQPARKGSVRKWYRIKKMQECNKCRFPETCGKSRLFPQVYFRTNSETL